MELRHNGQPQLVLEQDLIRREERYLGDLERAMQVVLPDGRANDDTLERRMLMLTDAIRKAGKSFAIKAESGTIELVSRARVQVPNPRTKT